MFSFFKKTPAGISIRDIVFMNEEGRNNALLQKDPDTTVFICWFESTKTTLQDIFTKQGKPANHIFWYKQLNHIQNKTVIFTEHYPLASKEKELFEKLMLEKAVVYSSLTDPLFIQFGGEKIIEILRKLGMDKNESIEHNMITSAIAKAQEKIAQKVQFEQTANSQKEWITRNIKD